jgi:hypothetical protein
MGVGMQLCYLGFEGSAALEAEAGVALVRLERAAKRIAGCRLEIEARDDRPGHRVYDARLDLVTRNYGLIPGQRTTHEDVITAVHLAFEAAFRLLENAD